MNRWIKVNKTYRSEKESKRKSETKESLMVIYHSSVGWSNKKIWL